MLLKRRSARNDCPELLGASACFPLRQPIAAENHNRWCLLKRRKNATEDQDASSLSMAINFNPLLANKIDPPVCV